MDISRHISVDSVVFGYSEERLHVLLVKRQLKESIADFDADWTLIGNHVYAKERVEEAAYRVLKEITGLSDIYLEHFRSFAAPDRLMRPKDQQWLNLIGKDPAERVVSIGFYALVDRQQVQLQQKEREVSWVPVNEVGQLGFDHNEILDEALKALREKMRHEPIGFELLPEKFTLTELQSVYEQIFDTTFDKRNFRKKVKRMKYVVPLQEKQQGVPHKPARLYQYSEEIYQATKEEIFDFVV